MNKIMENEVVWSSSQKAFARKLYEMSQREIHNHYDDSRLGPDFDSLEHDDPVLVAYISASGTIRRAIKKVARKKHARKVKKEKK
jgi:hypothetical protein